MANVVREQIEPMIRAQTDFLERQEARDKRQEQRDVHVFELVKSLVDQVVELAHTVGKLESRLAVVEARCTIRHGGGDATGPTTRSD